MGWTDDDDFILQKFGHITMPLISIPLASVVQLYDFNNHKRSQWAYRYEIKSISSNRVAAAT